MKAKVVLPLILLLGFALTLSSQTAPASGGAGVNGNISAGVYTAQYDMPIAFWCENLDTSSDYGIVIKSTGEKIANFTTATAQTTFQITLSFTSADATADVVTVQLADGGANELDAVYLYMQDLDDLGPTGFFIDLGVMLLILGIIVAIVTGLISYRRG